ncbi:odorant receptor 9a-like [Leptopilina boulardi]|uniref:odorant receptor 9a-like n=1 Tax=Leptopilina boulardi TaxID=63433 RepID=UPI0021F53EDE|nr:odorant receptor 9a-like [Leptopilina boulardi]
MLAYVKTFFAEVVLPGLPTSIGHIPHNCILQRLSLKYNFDFAVKFNRWSMQLCGMWPIEDLFSIRPLIEWIVDSSSKINLPCQAYYPFDVEKSPNFELAYLTQTFFMGCLVTVAINVNSFLTLIVFHLCGQLQVLALSVKDIVNSKKFSHNGSMISEELEVVITVMTMCFVGFAILVSMNIGDAVYNTNWYDCNPKSICSLMLIIMRSQRPLKFTAGKFFPLSHDTLKKILMSAFSYATVLHATSRNHQN